MITMPEDDGKNQTFKQMGEFEMDKKKTKEEEREMHEEDKGRFR